MSDRTQNHTPRLEGEISEFLLERQIRKVSARTLQWHTHVLAKFAAFCYTKEATSVREVTATTLRHFILHLESSHNTGGIANIFRSVKAFLNFCEVEYEQQGWTNPARKVKIATSKIEAFEPISVKDFQKMLATCERKSLAGDRDRAFLMFLMDTGIRKAEITALTVNDIDMATGSVLIRQGKGGKSRTVFIGASTRRALSAYMRQREAYIAYAKARSVDALWIHSQDAKKLGYAGVREILRRRAKDAGIPEPSPHSFRRAFAVNSLRNGMNVLALQRLLGHSDLSTINRYVKLLKDDLRVAHEQHGVVDNL
jgi:integrase/recombinase XerD